MSLDAPSVRLSALGLLVGALACPSLAADGPPDGWPSGKKAVEAAMPALPPGVAAALEDGRFAEAAVGLEALGREATDADARGYHGLIRGVALRLAGRLDQAREVLEGSLAASPKGAWSAKLRAELAAVQLASGRPKEAEALARAEVEALLAVDRKDRLAEGFRAFASRLLASDDPLARPDPSAAHALLVQARSLARGEPLRARLLFEAASASLAANQAGPAIEEFRAYVAEHPAGPDRDAARFLLGEVRRLAGQAVEARNTWSDLARDKATTPDFRARALYMVAQTYGKPPEPPRLPIPSRSNRPMGGGFQSVTPGLSSLVMESRSIPPPASDADLTLQVSALRRLITTVPAHPLAARAAYEIGASSQSRGKAEEALVAFRAFLAGEGFRAEGDESRRLVAELTPPAMFAVGEVLESQGRLDEAIASWSAYLARYPSGGGSEKAQRAILDAKLKRAGELSGRREFAGARAAWSEFIAQNPLDPRVPEALYRVAGSDRVEGKPDEAIVAFESLIARFPDSEPGRHARFALGTLFEEDKGDPARAIERYRSLKDGPWAAQAGQRVAVLDRPSLQVVTPRTFRSGEPAHLEIASRNLARLSFAAYKLDPEAYFRKKLAFKGVEALDVGLVAPDAEWSEPVPGFARYKPVAAKYELKPLQGHGFWAVKVTDEANLQATTMVLRGDLDALVRSSREQAIVFVQDRKTGLGRKGARVLLHDGREKWLEGRTGDDGVVLFDWPDRQWAETPVNYLVLDGLEAAGSGFGLTSQVGRVIWNRVYLYTDRPAYRPGQAVEVRGVVRDFVDGSYEFTAGEDGQLEVLDSQGRRIAARTVKLSEFGTFHESIQLAGEAPVGEYAFRLARAKGGITQGQFRVEAYALEKADLKVDLPRSVVFRGEVVQAEAVARTQYGTPLAGRPVEVALPDGRTLRGSTDAGGRFPFEFATEGFAEEQTVSIAARLPEENVATSANVVVAVRAFRIDLATDREVYLVGETFRLRALTVDPLGSPVGQSLAVSILKRVDRGGAAVGEREVGTARLETDPKTGRGVVALKVDDEDGGSFVVRASSTDRFGNAIVEDRPIAISGRKDATGLRFLGDRTSFKVGEVAKVDLHVREGSGLTLVTWEVERVLRYKLVDVKVGRNPVEWAVEGPEFPNFTLAAARMDGARLDEARLDLRVERDLRVGLKALRPSVGPGEEVVVEVTTLDQLDRPVAAELSLALVDRALLRVFADAVPPIGPFFHDRIRTGAFTTGATNAFRYAPPSRPVAGALKVAAVPPLAGQRPEPGVGDAFDINEQIVVRGRSGRSRRKTIHAYDLIGGASDPASRAIIAKLGEAVSMSFPTETSLEEIKKYIEQSTRDPAAGLPNGIPIYVDPIGLQDADKTMADTVTINLEGIPLKTTLRLLLNQVSLTYDIADGLLTITSISSNDDEGPDEGDGFIGGAMGGGMGGMIGGGMGGSFGPIKTDAVDPNSEPRKEPDGGMMPEAQPPRPPQAPAPAQPPARQQFVETAYWNPAVVTGADGKATVRFKSPSALSEYVFMARGITGLDTLAGQATADLAVRKGLFVDFRTPPILLQGDSPRFSAKVHHSGLRGRVEVGLAIYAGDRQQVDPRTLEVAGDGVDEVRFDPFEVPDGDVLRLVVSAKGGDQADEVVAEVPIRPWGVREYATASGRSSDDASAFVSLPAGRVHEGADMLIAIAPTTERLLIDAALGQGGAMRGGLPVEPTGTTADRASDLVATASALEYLGSVGAAEVPERIRLADRAKGLVAGLLASQRGDGGWPTFEGVGGASTSDGVASASIVWALHAAEGVGLLADPDAPGRSIGFLTQRLAQADANDHEARAALLHALALRGKGGFEAANALNRVRDDLSDVALAYLALTFSRLDRPALAGEVLGVLAGRAKLEAVGPGRQPRRWWSGGKGASGGSSAIEATGLAALAFTQVRRPGPELEGAVEWLLAHRSGVAWRPNKANGPAVAALASFHSRAKSAGDRYRLVVRVNGKEVDRFEVAGRVEGRTIAVPRSSLKADGVNQVAFDIEGRGTFGYSVTMAGFTRTFDPAPGAPKPEFVVHRTYLAASPEFEGRTLPIGFDSVVNATAFDNPTRRVATGGRVLVAIDAEGAASPGRRGSYLVLEEPLPAGASLVEGSVRSSAVTHRLEDGVLSFYFAPGQAPSAVRYELFGLIAGRYRALPPRLLDADDPGRSALGPPGDLTVLEPGEAATDPYRPTPDELYARGKALFDAGRLAEAAAPLEALKSDYKARDDVSREVARMLLFSHLANYQPRKVVEDYETIREKASDLVIPFEKLLAIGRAYADIGEHERAYLGWQALAEASYLEDSRFAEALRQRGKPLEAAAFLLGLWREYPDEASIESDFFGLSRLLASLATRAESDAVVRDDLASNGVSKADLLAQAARLARAFLAQAPRNPLAEEASLALLGDELERKDYAEVVTLAGRFARVFATSPSRDRFLYSEALGRFHLGQFDRAVEIARAISSRGGPSTEENGSDRMRAEFLSGQIEEARGRPREALEYYRNVSSRFTDAAEAVQSLTRQVFKLPEVSVIRPGVAKDPASKIPPGVALTYRNVEEAEIKVFPVDLMRFYLSRRGLGAVSSIDLAGVRPLAQFRLKLGEGSDFEDKLKGLDLPLKDEGAFLVIARGANLFASGIVLVSTLEMDVAEQAAGGLLRVTVRDSGTGARLPEVQIKVIGSANGEFVGGQADLRGVFLAQGLKGQADVVARLGSGRYALHRGTIGLGPVAPGAGIGPGRDRDRAASLEDDLRERNQANQERQLDRFERRQGGIGGGMGGMRSGGFM